MMCFVRICLIASASGSYILKTDGGLLWADFFYIAVPFVNGTWFRGGASSKYKYHISSYKSKHTIVPVPCGG